MSHDWDARYAAEPRLWGAEPNAHVRERLAQADPGHLVDLACGHGRNALWLARRGCQVTAVDHSAVALDQGRAHAAELGLHVDWVRADVRCWAPPGPVDVAVVSYLHRPVRGLVALLRSAAAWLRPGGRLIYLGHSRSNRLRGVGGPSEPAVLPEIADLARAADGLRTVALQHRLQPTGAISFVLDVAPWPTCWPAEAAVPAGTAHAAPAPTSLQERADGDRRPAAVQA